jgi:predicted phosphodiesterase
LVTAAAVLAPVLNYYYRNGYVFIDHETFYSLARLLYVLMWVNAAFACTCLGVWIHAGRLGIGMWIGFGFSVLFTLLFTMVNLVSGKLTFNENLKMAVRPLRFKFMSGAMVLDLGTGYYAVVFGTSKRSQGYVTYRVKGEEKTSWSADGGVKRMGILHSCQIPREELENNSYQIHAIRVAERLSYGSRFGTVLHGDTYSFKGTRTSDTLTAVSVSDWHFRYQEMENAVAQMGGFDLLLTLGDGGDYFVNEQHAVKLLVKPLSIITKGQVPIIFTRGNHEVRADFDFGDFWRKLGYKDGFNYRVERGGYLFTVIDSAEAPDGHDEWEHKGCYDMLPYLNSVLAWLEQLEPRPDKYNIVMDHDANFSTPTDSKQDRYFAALERLGIQFGVSGHSHNFRFDEALHGLFPNIQDGGRFIRAGHPKGPLNGLLDVITKPVYAYRACKIEFTPSEIRITGTDDLGNSLGEYSVKK